MPVLESKPAGKERQPTQHQSPHQSVPPLPKNCVSWAFLSAWLWGSGHALSNRDHGGAEILLHDGGIGDRGGR